MRMTHSVLVSDRNISVDTPGYTITGFPSEQAAHLFLSLGLVVPPPAEDPFYQYFEEPFTLTVQLDEGLDVYE